MHDPTRQPDRLIVTDADLERLQPVLDQHASALTEALETELGRARIVAQRDVPDDVVTMNSEVSYEDLATGARREVRLVYPREANAADGKISVLAPLGAALLGLQVGQEIAYRGPAGVRRIRLVEIRYQPEAAGDYAR